MEPYKGKVRAYIIENFLFGDSGGLCDSMSLLGNGVIDSTGILELVEFLGTEFSITIADEDLVPENLDSIDNVTAYLRRKLGDAPSTVAVGTLRDGRGSP